MGVMSWMRVVMTCVSFGLSVLEPLSQSPHDHHSDHAEDADDDESCHGFRASLSDLSIASPWPQSST